MDERDIQARAVSTSLVLLAEVKSANLWRSGDGRVGETDAAALLGWSVQSLRNARAEGSGPPAYQLGGARHRISYRLTDLAWFIESRREK